MRVRDQLRAWLLPARPQHASEIRTRGYGHPINHYPSDDTQPLTRYSRRRQLGSFSFCRQLPSLSDSALVLLFRHSKTHPCLYLLQTAFGPSSYIISTDCPSGLPGSILYVFHRIHPTLFSLKTNNARLVRLW
ncbi:hypothetical protein G7K_4939-t1 [Saitoella complicata NRRL Y-17804]|uniref:Uncharacterized protein n=1 Tax=Saitoella complicata (strain BCRC 22490 / CBS 7301 / JCM 7358 / NBRC 10748 / NRRL Y-17804) TaxID=698492 RepID=A0A0E9NLX9_SAICN|nr:hypothetical protein G7K_4939-t1 [Saitoella complicata NRRL Y-17804]